MDINKLTVEQLKALVAEQAQAIDNLKAQAVSGVTVKKNQAGDLVCIRYPHVRYSTNLWPFQIEALESVWAEVKAVAATIPAGLRITAKERAAMREQANGTTGSPNPFRR